MTMPKWEVELFLKNCNQGLKKGDSDHFIFGSKLKQLCEAWLRLAAIENVGDEEVESLHESFYKLLPLNTLEARRCGAFDTACELLKERNQVVAELRAKLGERESLLRTLYDSPSIGEIANDDTYYRLEKFIAGSEVGGG